jgi:hypothetical protein
MRSSRTDGFRRIDHSVAVKFSGLLDWVIAKAVNFRGRQNGPMTFASKSKPAGLNYHQSSTSPGSRFHWSGVARTAARGVTDRLLALPGRARKRRRASPCGRTPPTCRPERELPPRVVLANSIAARWSSYC